MSAAPPSNQEGLHLNQDVLKRVCLFSALPEVHSLSLVCTEWKETVWGDHDLWKELLLRRYPNLRVISGTIQGSRNAFLHRVGLQHPSGKLTPVRYLGIPTPLQLKTPGQTLLNQWEPESIVFSLDIWKGKTCIISHFFRKKLGEGGHQPAEFSTRRGKLTVQEQVDCLATQEVMDILGANFLPANAPIHLIQEEAESYCSVSFCLEGPKVPQCDPIILLSEHRPFFAPDGFFIFRTDINNHWIGLQNTDRDTHELDTPQVLDLHMQHQAKYGCTPLPFDPCVELYNSPKGDAVEIIGGFINNNTEDVYSLRADIGFMGHDQEDLLRVLLSLWNDAARARNSLWNDAARARKRKR